MPELPSISAMDEFALRSYFEGMGEKGYRAKQVLQWLYVRYAGSFDEMTDLPYGLRKKLSSSLRLTSLDLLVRKEGPDKWSKKYLWGRANHPLVESVLLKYKYGLTGCVSTQVGCPIGCAFCASGLTKYERDLEPVEMLDQVLGMAIDQKSRIGHVVFMGTGEPFLNYESSLKAIALISDPGRLGLSRRRVTVSTVGIPDRIRSYAKDCGGARLAISLHAADDEKRSILIPLNRVYPIGQVIEAAREFARETGQRVTFEYMLIDGFNDGREDADRLGEILKGIDCLVNIIPWNEVPEFRWRRPGEGKVKEFRAALERNLVKVTVRRSLGGAIEASCGQLRRESELRY